VVIVMLKSPLKLCGYEQPRIFKLNWYFLLYFMKRIGVLIHALSTVELLKYVCMNILSYLLG
jgi:hypothetical protein